MHSHVLIALVVATAALTPAPAAQIAMGGYTLPEHAAPDAVLIYPTSDVQFDGAVSGCVGQADLTLGGGHAELVRDMFTDDTLEFWVQGRVDVRLDFTDNSIVNAPGPDFVVFELGGSVIEPVEVTVWDRVSCGWGPSLEVSTGLATGTSTSTCGNVIFALEVDLDAFGLPPGAVVSRLRIRNLGEPDTYQGSDIGAVMALRDDAAVPFVECEYVIQAETPDSLPGSTVTDTYLSSMDPTNSFLDDDTLWVTQSGDTRQALIGFPLLFDPDSGVVPSGAPILGADLTVTLDEPVHMSEAIEAWRMTTFWSPHSSWFNFPGGQGVMLGQHTDTAVIDLFLDQSEPQESFSFDMLSAVSAWAAGELEYGIALLNYGSQPYALRSTNTDKVYQSPTFTIHTEGVIVRHADAVHAFAPAVLANEPSVCALDESAALGMPDLAPGTCCSSQGTFVALGSGGEIVLTFDHVGVSGDGSAAVDLIVHEAGSNENVFIDLSVDGSAWLPVGQLLGSEDGVDLDAFGIGPFDRFPFVRLRDDPNDGPVTGCTVGADIDAITARSVNGWSSQAAPLSGTLGAPLLSGAGQMSVGQDVVLRLTNALPGGSATLVIGASVLAAPFKGGTLVPNPDLIIAGLPVDGSGTFELSTVWSDGIPAGLTLAAQFWIQDAGAVNGLAATNGIVDVTD